VTVGFGRRGANHPRADGRTIFQIGTLLHLATDTGDAAAPCLTGTFPPCPLRVLCGLAQHGTQRLARSAPAVQDDAMRTREPRRRTTLASEAVATIHYRLLSEPYRFRQSDVLLPTHLFQHGIDADRADGAQGSPTTGSKG